MDHDTAAEHSARETRGTGSSSSPAEDNSDDGTSRPDHQAPRERHDMNQAAPAATVPPVLPNHELPGTAVGTLPPQGSEVALQASAGSEGEAPTEPKVTSLEGLFLPSGQEAGCDSVSGDDRSQSEATTGSVSPAPAACFSSDATPAGGGAPSPPASVAEAAAAKETQSRMFPQTGPPDKTPAVALIPSSTSSVMSFQQQQDGRHHPPAKPTYSPSLAASAAVLHGGPAAGAAAAAAEEGEKNARMMSSPSAKEPPSSASGPTAEPRDNSLPPSPPPEHENQNQGQREAATAASAATTITTLEEGCDYDTNIHADDAQQQHQPSQRQGGVLVGGAQDDRPISDNPASTISASTPSYESHHRLVQHTRRHVNEPHQPPAVLHPGGAATDVVAATATTSKPGQFHAGGLQPAFGNHNAYAQPPAAAATAYYGHHQPIRYSAGGPTPPPPPGTMLGGAGLPYHSHQSGFVLPDTGRAPLLSAPPPRGGCDRYDLVPPGAAYDLRHGHQHIYQPQHPLYPRQQQFELGRPDALASAATATPAEHPRPDAIAGAPQTLTEGVLTMLQSSSGGAASGGVRGGAPAAAQAAVLGTAAGVMAAAAAGGRAGGDAVQNNAYNDIGLVVTRTKELEKIMRDSFHATGNGLNELLSSLRTDRRIDPRTQQRIRSIAAMRNKLVHSVDANNLTMSNTFGASARKAFKVMCDDLELSLRDCAAKVVEEPFEQAARPADAFRLGNHPAFRGIGGAGAGGAGEDGDYDEAAGIAEAEAAEVARREQEALIVKDNARFPHNLITAKRKNRHTQGSAAPPAPDVNDEGAFPDINFASSAAVQQQSRRAARGEGAAGGGGGQVPPGPSQGGGR
ncbi:unnamed protein product, partial [Ectocarpus sp. 6 AP-2014]